MNFYGYQSPAPADYLAATGHTTLATIRPSLRFDNRNSPFMPNKGQYLEFSFEQGWGTFTYPKAEVEGRTYFTTGEPARRLGQADPDLPRPLRRRPAATRRSTSGSSPATSAASAASSTAASAPRRSASNVGGVMEALGSVEYQFPWTANDMFHQVVFCDFGTVENDYRFNNFRVSVGTGLRMLIPAFGPLPLCFDLAFPVEKAPGDRVQFFNFTIGAFY